MSNYIQRHIDMKYKISRKQRRTAFNSMSKTHKMNILGTPQSTLNLSLKHLYVHILMYFYIKYVNSLIHAKFLRHHKTAWMGLNLYFYAPVSIDRRYIVFAPSVRPSIRPSTTSTFKAIIFHLIHISASYLPYICISISRTLWHTHVKVMCHGQRLLYWKNYLGHYFSRRCAVRNIWPYWFKAKVILECKMSYT